MVQEAHIEKESLGQGTSRYEFIDGTHKREIIQPDGMIHIVEINLEERFIRIRQEQPEGVIEWETIVDEDNRELHGLKVVNEDGYDQPHYETVSVSDIVLKAFNLILNPFSVQHTDVSEWIYNSFDDEFSPIPNSTRLIRSKGDSVFTITRHIDQALERVHISGILTGDTEIFHSVQDTAAAYSSPEMKIIRNRSEATNYSNQIIQSIASNRLLETFEGNLEFYKTAVLDSVNKKKEREFPIGLHFVEGERDLESNNVTSGFYNEETGLYTRYEFERVGEALRLFASATYNPETDNFTYVSYHGGEIFRAEGNSSQARWTYLKPNEGKGYETMLKVELRPDDIKYFLEFICTGTD